MKTAFMRLAVAVLAALALTGAGIAAAEPAAAVTNHCGTGYNLIDTYPIKWNGTLYGRIYLYWSPGANRNCAVNYGKNSAYGFKGFKSVSVCPSGTTDGTLCGGDHGQYYYYAGPAYTKRGYDMSGKCVDVFGMIERPNGQTLDGGAMRVHCG